jgi:hypothetical protein
MTHLAIAFTWLFSIVFVQYVTALTTVVIDG